MIIGAHSIVYSRSPELDRAFLRDVLGLPSVDAGEGWLIFGLPPAEVAIHPADENDTHELYLMCDDVEAFVAGVKSRGVSCGPVLNRGWGLLTELELPGGGKLGVYQPRHASPKPMKAARAGGNMGARAKSGRSAGRKAAARKAAKRSK